jgi:hypothetical protein
MADPSAEYLRRTRWELVIFAALIGPLAAVTLLWGTAIAIAAGGWVWLYILGGVAAATLTLGAAAWIESRRRRTPAQRLRAALAGGGLCAALGVGASQFLESAPRPLIIVALTGASAYLFGLFGVIVASRRRIRRDPALARSLLEVLDEHEAELRRSTS